MMSHPRRPLVAFLLLGLTFLLAGSIPASAAVKIAKVLPFATDTEVRVQTHLAGERGASGLELTGTIVPADKEGKKPAGQPLWSGPLGPVSGASAEQVVDVKDLKPSLWTPATPNLYFLTVTAKQNGKRVDEKTVRFGFRSFGKSDAGQFLLNGKPIFLRGLAINPPERGLSDEVAYSKQFVHDYVKFLRSRNINIIRMTFQLRSDPRQQVWFDTCDELGMMVYQGNYGAPPAGTKGDADPEDDRDDNAKGKPPKDFDASIAAYREVFELYAPHPSIVIYVMSNELPGPVLSRPEWHDYLTRAIVELREFDDTRLYLGNAGYGLGREGDINDVHRYWGWYYNSFLTYYNLRDTDAIYGKAGVTDKLPFTFSECVGSFTSAHGQFNHTFRKQLGAALAWTGHSYDPADDALAYQSFMVKQACESFRRMREVNPKLGGLMPFTIQFYHWNGVQRFDQMKPKPSMEQMGVSYQPVLLSWENWTPNVYAGSKLNLRAHVINDAEDFSDLSSATLVYELALKGSENGKPIVEGRVKIPAVPYYGQHKSTVGIDVPADAAAGEYVLRGRIVKGGKDVSHNETPLFVASRAWATEKPKAGPAWVVVYDPSGKTAEALEQIGVSAKVVGDLKKLDPKTPLVIGEMSADASVKPFESALKQFVARGGRVLCLAQDGERFEGGWLPTPVKHFGGLSINHWEYQKKDRPTPDHMNVNPERPDHAVFRGLSRPRFHLWSDYTNWDQTKDGFPALYPVRHGFKLAQESQDDLSRVAILANYDRGLEGIALCEMFPEKGDGSVLMTGFDLVGRVEIDPVAARVLTNLVAYLGEREHPRYVVIDKPIRWGNYSTERGVVTGVHNGLTQNCRWLPPPTNSNAKPLKDNTGAWNTLPGEQFVPVGVRPLGPFGYNANTAPRDLNPDSKTGWGFFFATLASPRRAMVTKVENPSNEPARLEAEVNGVKQSVTVPPGKTATLRNGVKLKPNSRDVSVRYAGDKDLVILGTSFE